MSILLWDANVMRGCLNGQGFGRLLWTDYVILASKQVRAGIQKASRVILSCTELKLSNKFLCEIVCILLTKGDIIAIINSFNKHIYVIRPFRRTT